MAKRNYARGTKAWGHDARTGERVLVNRLVRDGQTGVPVLPSSYEPRHPQERVVDVTDPETLANPAPDLDRPGIEISWPTGPADELWRTYPMPSLTMTAARVFPTLSAPPSTTDFRADSTLITADDTTHTADEL